MQFGLAVLLALQHLYAPSPCGYRASKPLIARGQLLPAGCVDSLLYGRACRLTSFVEHIGSLITWLIMNSLWVRSQELLGPDDAQSPLPTLSSMGLPPFQNERFGSRCPKATYMADLGSSLWAIKMKSAFPKLLKGRCPSWRCHQLMALAAWFSKLSRRCRHIEKLM